jgi:hypothetical protein
VIVPVTAIKAVALVLQLGPELRNAVVALIKAIQGDDEAEARRAYEAARRAAFIARQK